MTRTPRLLAGTLVLALPLAAAVGCGAEKKKTVRQEFAAAQDHLGDSRSAAFTLRFVDQQGNFAKVLTKDDTPAALAKALVGGSITYVADPEGDKTLREAQSQTMNPADLSASLGKVNVAFVVRDDKAELVELRVVGGDLYAHVNMDEVQRLAEAGGVEDFDATLDEGTAGAPPELAKALTDVRAGKWIKLPLAKYLDQLQELAGSLVPGASPAPSAKPYDASGLAKRALDAVKPYVKVTDANDDSTDRVLDVRVQVRPALKAVLGVLKAEKGLPFGQVFGQLDPAEVDKAVKDGEARGTITLHESHLTSFEVDLESLRQLSDDPGEDSFAGVRVHVDVDDSADGVDAPKDVSTVDLGALLDQFLGAFTQGASSSSSMGYSFSS